MDGAALDVRHTPAPIEHLLAIDVVKERVDGEVAAQSVFVSIAKNVVATNEDVLERLPTLFFGRLHGGISPERCDLDDFAPEEDMGQTKAPADDAAVAEERSNILGPRARGDVEIFWFAAEKEVSDAAPDE